MFKNISKALWFTFVPLYILGISTIAMLATGVIPLYYLWATLVMWALCSGLGIAVGYHRVFSHLTHKLPAWKENIILFFGTFAGQSSVIFWVALHRGYHHPFSDTKKDLHSPVAYSNYEAFMGWFTRVTEANNPVKLKYAVDLMRKPNVVFFHKHYYKIFWLVPMIVAMFDWRLALTAFSLVGFIGLNADNAVNIVGHKKALIGYRNFDTDDQSQNNWLWGYFGWGQGWHNNHHAVPAAFDFGTGASGKWWEFDPCRIFLPFLGKARNG